MEKQKVALVTRVASEETGIEILQAAQMSGMEQAVFTKGIL